MCFRIDVPNNAHLIVQLKIIGHTPHDSDHREK